MSPSTLLSAVLVTSAALTVRAQTYSATYLPSNAPAQSEQGQSGTNQCSSTSSQTSNCQNVFMNAVDDFCLFAPPEPGANATIGDTERIEVSWCIKDGHGTRLIPDGAITGAHFVQTPDYVQVTGMGDLTKLKIPSGDSGGELDPHGADGNGNPIGGLVFSSAFGQLAQMHEWTNFMSDTLFCFRACKDGPMAPALCNHIYDVLGCFWNMPADYDAGVFEHCQGDSGEPMGVYGTSTFFQGEPVTPSAHAAPSSSLCTTLSTIGNGFAISGTSVISSAASSGTASGGSSSSASSTAPPSSSSSSSASASATSTTTGSSSSSGSSEPDSSVRSTLTSSTASGSGSASGATLTTPPSGSGTASPSQTASAAIAVLPMQLGLYLVPIFVAVATAGLVML
ncbi:hypothetical protein PUNSTDRAFT_52672 [Punctularia strigosozonata HHB-11173 SS5]|uniref:uncharacterized protein n=1 Tax=Punctularia strigosozonata (strain HHB-11173) TaxID=741275 RepID=UPI0004416260|nr:uncharacterized protein PUNSTDRAFT_52672 [Punctularia strigosozonata HHB-11173 SS5]EIN08212.1 hypothetical protein PUNSTDRAFT_52672 [Punctularia strigosozonata HHB-11173 SS5]